MQGTCGTQTRIRPQILTWTTIQKTGSCSGVQTSCPKPEKESRKMCKYFLHDKTKTAQRLSFVILLFYPVIQFVSLSDAIFCHCTKKSLEADLIKFSLKVSLYFSLYGQNKVTQWLHDNFILKPNYRQFHPTISLLEKLPT